MKKIIILMFLLVLLIGTVSAGDWWGGDNFKKYDSETGNIEIWDKGFFLFGKDTQLAELTLIDNTYSCMYNCEANLRLDLKVTDNNIIKKVETWNLAKTKKEAIEEIKVYIRGEPFTAIRNEYSVGECNKDGTICEHIVKEVEYIDYYWNEYKGEELEAGTYYFKVKGKKEIEQSVDWMAIIFGIRTDEYAVWTTDLENSIMSYYNCSDATDQVSGYDFDGSVTGVTDTGLGLTDNLTCNGTLYVTDNDPFAFVNDNNWSMSGWFKHHISGDAGKFIGSRVTDDGWLISMDSNDYLRGVTGASSGFSDTHNQPTSSILASGEWIHIALTVNSSSACIWINGTMEDCENPYGSRTDSGTRFTYADNWDNSDPTLTGWDEIGWWNRTLTPSEISDLYNSGSGISRDEYGDQAPDSYLNEPEDYYNSTETTFTLNYSCVDDYNVTNITLYLNGTENLTTINGTDTTVNISTTINLPDGMYEWNSTCMDNSSNQGNSPLRYFSIDSTNPAVNITQPLSISYHTASTNLTVNFTASDTNLDSCWYSWNNGTSNTSVTCADANFTTNITSRDNASVTLYANDTFGYENSFMRNWSYIIFENSISFNSETYEGSIESFTLNITYDSSSFSSISSNLNYNGTDYESTLDGSGDNIVYANNITVPDVSEQGNNTFYWTIGLYDGSWSYYNSSSDNQTANPLLIDDCTTYPTLIYNFTSYDEENKSILSNTTIDIQFNLYDSEKVNNIINYSKRYSETNPATLCFNSSLFEDSSFLADLTVKYTANDTTTNKSYAKEYYNIVNQEITNTSLPINVSLYDLDIDDSTEFQLTFRDAKYILAPNILVYLYRQYVGDNDYKIVEAPITDSNGQTILHMVRNDVVYNIVMLNSSNDVIATFNRIIAFCQDYTIGSCTIDLNAPSPTDEIYNYTNELGISYSAPSYSDVTGLINFSFVSLNSSSLDVTMEVLRNNQFGNRSVCLDSITSATGTLNCNVSNVTSTDRFFFINIYINDNFLLLKTIDTERSTSSGFGIVNGGFYAFLLMLVLITIFTDDKQVLMIALGVGWAVVVSIGLINGKIIGSLSGGIWLIICIIMMIWKLNKEEKN
jgi:hypothetical protein